jgi:hypothetical protein
VVTRAGSRRGITFQFATRWPHSARLGSARLGSARLGSARLGIVASLATDIERRTGSEINYANHYDSVVSCKRSFYRNR